jgi:hypothetical protein
MHDYNSSELMKIEYVITAAEQFMDPEESRCRSTFSLWRLLFLAALLLFSRLPATQAQQIQAVDIGLQGTCKVGCWTRVRIDLQGGSSNKKVRVDIDAADSDGVTARFEGDTYVTLEPDRTFRLEQYVKLGRLVDLLEIRLVDKDGNQVDKLTTPLPTVSTSTQPRIVSLFGDIGLKRWVGRQQFDDDQRPIIVAIASATDLPHDARGWDGVERVSLATADNSWQKITTDQWDALEQWLLHGGELVLLAGKNGKIVSRHDRLSRWLPGPIIAVETIRENPALEDYSSSDSPLPPIEVSRLERVDGLVEVRFGSRDRSSGPAVVHRSFGFGTIRFCGIDVDQDPMASWTARGRLVEQMLGLRRSDWKNSNVGNRSLVYGYTEMSGQLRSALDDFQGDEDERGVKVFPVSLIIGSLVVYVLLIGPFDFFFLQRFVGRMEWTWVSFPILFIGACTTILFVNSWRLGGKETRLNQVDVVDVDLSEGTVRGTTWANLFTAQSNLFDLSASTQIGVNNCQVAEQSLLWQGLPGQGFGSFQSRVSAPWSDRHYTIRSKQGRLVVNDLPIPATSSRSLIAQWRGTVDEPPLSELKEDSFSVLTGVVTNPLKVTLVRPMLVHRQTIYRLGERLRPGQRISVRNQPRRDLEWELTRRRTYSAEHTSYTTTKWDPHERDIPRIVEVMLLHQAAGGSDYTKLNQRYQGEIDLTAQLKLGRAILWGEVETPALHLTVNNKNATSNAEKHWTFYRVLIPVQSANSGTSVEER